MLTTMPINIRPARLILLSAIAVSTIVMSTLLLLSQLRTRELVHAEGETVSLSNIIAEQMTRSLQSVDMALRIAQDRLVEAERQGVSLDDSAIHAMLKSRVASMPHLIALFVVDSDGRAVNSSRNFPSRLSRWLIGLISKSLKPAKGAKYTLAPLPETALMINGHCILLGVSAS